MAYQDTLLAADPTMNSSVQEGDTASGGTHYAAAPGKPLTVTQAFDLYNKQDPLLAQYVAAGDPVASNIASMVNYFSTDPNQQMTPGSKWLSDPAAAQRLYDSAQTQWAKDAQPGLLDKIMSKAPLVAAAAVLGQPEFLGGLGTVAGTTEAGMTAADGVTAALDAAQAAGTIAAPTAGLTSAELASAAASAAPAAGGLAGASAIDKATEAATNYLSKYMDPSFLASEAGKAVVSNAVSQLITTGSIDPSKLMDPESFAKNMALGAVTGAGTAAGSSGLQSLGLAKNVANPLAGAGMAAIQGRSPVSSLVSAAGNYAGLSPSVMKYASPAVTGLITGNGAGLQSSILKGVLDQVQVPQLDWNKSGSPLSWVSPAINSGLVRGVANKLKG